jgi:DNA-binding LacI/PurR family transcriptional regulator
MQACQDAGLEIPQDILFIGYDDIMAAQRSRPALSTVRVNKEELGRRAARHLIQGEVSIREELLPVELLIRDSSRRS